jgi:membrane-associated phospholipid phosphatase
MLRSVSVVLLTFTALAAADPTPPQSPQPQPQPAPTPDAGSAANGGITPPAPDAPPDKVEQAKQVAQTAKLTPIIPNPSNPTRPAFQLYAETDVPILAVGVVFAFARLVKVQEASCAPLCTDKNSINALDRLVAGRYSAAWSTASDFELYGLGLATAGLLVADEGVLSALNDGVVIGEATLSATATASIMTLAAGRPRPFLYSTAAPLSVRDSADAGLSFLSSHAAEAFAITTSLFIAERRLHPNSSRATWILAAGLGVSSMIAASRVLAGYHFITDVVGGAVVGSSLGVLVGSLHGSPVSVVPVVSRDERTNTTNATLGLHGSF